MDYSFGNWIKRRRKALDISQRELADRVGCSVSAIFKIESDARRPSRQIAELLAEHLQIPPEQRPQFLKVARRERMVDSLEPLPVPLEPLSQPAQIPQPAAEPPDSTIPQPLTPLVGREHELRLVVQQLLEPHCRVLTLTGLGGVGKTRLALEAAARLQERFAGGVLFVPLAGVSDPEFILPAIADVLGFPFSGTGEPQAQLVNYLREKEILLVLDNLEHLLPGVALLVGILEGAPRVKLLVTSREPLNLVAEWAFEVQGLPVPEGEAGESLQTSSAVQLFVQRARQARLGFEMGVDDGQAVQKICRLVEGLPLGIELAATWVRALSCQQIAAEIEQSLDFLKATAQDLPERHRSLRAVLDHSWELLTDQEKEVLQRLSVFRGGFSRAAALEVAGAGLEELASLANKSLVKRAGEGRYDLHELVRQYAAARLVSDRAELVQTREGYSRYYAGRLEGWQRPLRSPRQMEILEEMSAEIDNLRQALGWMAASGQFGEIRRSLLCLWYFHEILGRFQEGEILFGQVAGVLQSFAGAEGQQDAERRVVLGRMLGQQAYFSTQLGRYEQASASLQRSLALLRATPDQASLSDVLIFLAYLQYRQNEFPQARESILESQELHRARGNLIGLAYCQIILSYIHLDQGEYAQAYSLSDDSLKVLRELGDPHGIADSLITLSTAARQMGQNEQAAIWAQEGLEISRTTNDRWSAGQSLRQLGMIRFEQGKAQEAVDLLQQSISQFREVGDRPLLAETMIDLGIVLRSLGEISESKKTLMDAYRLAVETDDPAIASQALMEIGDLEMEQSEIYH